MLCKLSSGQRRPPKKHIFGHVICLMAVKLLRKENADPTESLLPYTTMYHLTAKHKVAEQYILRKYSNYNSFGVTIDLLNIKNFKVAITQLSNVQQV